MSELTLMKYVERLQGSGRYTFSREQALQATGLRPTSFEVSVCRLAQKKRLIGVRRGFFVIIPVEYRSSGILPPDWFIDDLMKYIGQPYYVALLSAAELHGAAHQRPQVFQAITSQATRDVEAAGLRIRFFKKAAVATTPTIMKRTFTGDIPVSTPAATALDLVAYERRIGRLNRVLTVLQELGESIEADSLAAAAQTYELPSAQRLGWLLDKAGFEPLTGKLQAWLDSQKTNAVALDPSCPAKGFARDPKWRVIVNTAVEGEL